MATAIVANAVPDFRFANHGSVTILTPITDAGDDWINSHIDPEAQRWGANGIVIEPRYAGDILSGLSNDGLTVEEV